MSTNPLGALIAYINKGGQRTALLKKNVAATLLVQVLSVAANLILVRVTIEYLGDVQYGVWITLSSVFTWFNVLDVGLSDGLRNKLGASIATNDDRLGRTYVSTTYAILSFIALIFMLCFLVANHFVDWSTVLNTSALQSQELKTLVVWLFGLFCAKFILNVLNSVFAADQRPAFGNVMSVGATLVSLVGMPLLFMQSGRSLYALAMLMSVPPVLLAFAVSVYFYRRRYRAFSPAPRYVDFSLARKLMSLGVQFFVLQVSVIVIFSTQNMVITQVLGPREVTPFSVAFKYFTVIGLIMRIAFGPLWSAFTDSFVKGDVEWIRKANRGATQVWFLSILGVIVLVVGSQPAYRLLAGSTVEIPFTLTALMALFTVQSGWNNIYSFFLNGVSKIRLQLILAVTAALVNIPLAIFLARDLGMGSSGVILATVLCLLPASIIQPIQYRKILSGTARGIFDR
ncbi:MAG: MATE family efflux transporter [Bacteroidota bacterium]